MMETWQFFYIGIENGFEAKCFNFDLERIKTPNFTELKKCAFDAIEKQYGLNETKKADIDFF